jgi:hypothetical protein
MRRPSRSGLSLVFALCVNVPLTAQNLESIGKDQPFSFAGSISINQILYASSGVPSRRDPYSYFASGNVNLSIYGWSVPLSFSVSNHNTSFSQPFNQYSVHPTWKSITIHAGYTSMSFSPYTVNGHVFLGAGIDIAPQGRWKFSALCGRFLKAVEMDTTAMHRIAPAFQRMGYALRATYGHAGNTIDVILFHAGDDPASIRQPPDTLEVAPQQNFVLSLAANKRIFKQFVVKAELATSALSRDVRAPKTDHDHLLAQSAALFQPRTSSSYYNAFKTSFDYQQEEYIVGLSYERIDPEYRTLGAYYFNNDLENMTVNASATLFGKKMTVAGSAGLQRNNLDKSKVSTMRRMVGSLNLQYTPVPLLNVSASWSSFQTYTRIRSQFETINQLTTYDNLDTLNFTQISRNASLSGIYTLPGGEKRKQSLTLNLTWQDAADKQGEVEQHSGTRFYNISAGYSVMLVATGITLAATFNTSINEGNLIQTKMLGPTASVSKSFLNRKFRTTLSSSCNNTYGNGIRINSVINCRVNGALSIRNKHGINVSAVAVSRTTSNREGSGKSFREFTGALGYSYTFGNGQ